MLKRVSGFLYSLIFAVLLSQPALAGFTSTDDAVRQSQQVEMQARLYEALQQDELRAKLVEQGVSPQAVEQRIAAMTPEEIAYLEAKFDELEAGAGVVGALFTLFLVFVFTDAICVTDIFDFVRCL